MLRLKLPPPEGNKTEQTFGLRLASLKQSGDLLWYGFEPFKLKLAKKTYYTPDFAAVWSDGQLEIYEVKGFWRDDARVKIKVAANLFPFFRFQAVTKKKDGWEYEEI